MFLFNEVISFETWYLSTFSISFYNEIPFEMNYIAKNHCINMSLESFLWDDFRERTCFYDLKCFKPFVKSNIMQKDQPVSLYLITIHQVMRELQSFTLKYGIHQGGGLCQPLFSQIDVLFGSAQILDLWLDFFAECIVKLQISYIFENQCILFYFLKKMS